MSPVVIYGGFHTHTHTFQRDACNRMQQRSLPAALANDACKTCNRVVKLIEINIYAIRISEWKNNEARERNAFPFAHRSTRSK